MSKIVWKSKVKIDLETLRSKRERECFLIVNRGVLWYNALEEYQKNDLSKWYDEWLKVTDTNVMPKMPKWLEEKEAKVEEEKPVK